jgi:NAD(P)H dehydrogenase (quinone)
LEFCGITPVRVNYIGIIKNSESKQREKWLQKVYEFGVQQK